MVLVGLGSVGLFSFVDRKCNKFVRDAMGKKSFKEHETDGGMYVHM